MDIAFEGFLSTHGVVQYALQILRLNHASDQTDISNERILDLLRLESLLAAAPTSNNSHDDTLLSRLQGDMYWKSEMGWELVFVSLGPGPVLSIYSIGDDRPLMDLKVGFCGSEFEELTRQSRSRFDMTAEEKNDMGEFDGLETVYIDESAALSFQIYAPDVGEVRFLASTRTETRTWIDAIVTSLRAHLDDEKWDDKTNAFGVLAGTRRDRRPGIFERLGDIGITPSIECKAQDNMDSDCIPVDIESTYSTNAWAHFYLVRDGTQIKYFEHSRSRREFGSIEMQYGRISLDIDKIKQGDFVVTLKSPMNSINVKARHEFHLAEAIVIVQRCFTKIGDDNSMSNFDSFQEALSHIRRVQISITSMRYILMEPMGIDLVEQTVSSTHTVVLGFIRRVLAYRATRLSPHRQDFAFVMEDEFFTPGCSKYLGFIPFQVQQAIKDRKYEARIMLYDEALVLCMKLLSDNYLDMFKNSSQYNKLRVHVLQRNLEYPTMNPLKRRIDSIPLFDNRCFSATYHSQGRLKHADFIPKEDQASLTMGREEVCSLIIPDSRISRIHARIYVSGETVFIVDLGSSHSIKLNNTKILASILQDGDIIEMGRVNIIFQLREPVGSSILTYCCKCPTIT